MVTFTFINVLMIALNAYGFTRTGYCNDRDISCSNWAASGECTGDNYEFMTRTCPHSCRVCEHRCRDEDVSCSNWARQGYCRNNSDFMLRTCPTSCGLCVSLCNDTSHECVAWADSGACHDNPTYMFRSAQIATHMLAPNHE